MSSTKTAPRTAKPDHLLFRARPLGDRVVVKVDVTADTTPGGIVLPQLTVAQNRRQVGTVIAVGPGRKLEPAEDGEVRRMPMDVEVGDRVVIQMFAGDAIDDSDNRDDSYRILREEDILAVVPAD